MSTAIEMILIALFWIGGTLSAISASLNANWYLSLPIFVGFCALVVKMNGTLPNWVFVSSTGLLAWQLFGWKVGMVAVVAYWGVTGTAGMGILIRALNTRTGTDNDGRVFMKLLLRIRLVAWSLGMIALALSKAALMLPRT
jgi:hypothetical protein